MSEKWRKVADALAERLMYHNGCGHEVREPSCPFCADAEAMAVYRKAVSDDHTR